MRILVATDGSADATSAIEWLMHLPLPADAAVDVVTVARPPIAHNNATGSAAYQRGADLVVLGARGVGAIPAFLVGSVSLGVVRQAPCAVLVCEGTPRPVQAVTVALDGSPDCDLSGTGRADAVVRTPDEPGVEHPPSRILIVAGVR